MFNRYESRYGVPLVHLVSNLLETEEFLANKPEQQPRRITTRQEWDAERPSLLTLMKTHTNLSGYDIARLYHANRKLNINKRPLKVVYNQVCYLRKTDKYRAMLTEKRT